MNFQPSRESVIESEGNRMSFLRERQIRLSRAATSKIARAEPSWRKAERKPGASYELLCKYKEQ